jgi:heptosyltransferase-2
VTKLALLKALDPLVLHLTESFLSRRANQASLSFGQSLDGTRDILLVAARELTDLLAIIPAARALRKRFPLARVHVLSSAACAPVLAHRPEIFEVVPWEGDQVALLSRAVIGRLLALRERGFDLAIAIDSGDARRERVLAALAGAKLRLGMHPGGADPTLNLVISARSSRGYRPAQSLEFLSFLGIPREQLTPSWEVPEADRRYAERLLELRRRSSAAWLLGVDPATGRSGVRPHPAKLAWLVDRVALARGAAPFIITEDPEAACVQEFKSLVKVPVVEAPSRGLRDVLAFAGCCRMFLGGNTSLLHFAVALGLPTVGVFPREEEARWIPEDHPGCRILRWSRGDRVRERDFLETVDAVLAADPSALPRGVSPEQPAEDDAPARARETVRRAPDPVHGHAPDDGDDEPADPRDETDAAEESRSGRALPLPRVSARAPRR